MSSRKLVDGALKKGRQKGIISEDFLPSWFQHFGFRANPFLANAVTWTEDEVELLINRSFELEVVAELIGMASSAEQGILKLALVGPDGVGKRSIAHTIDTIARARGVRGYVFDVANLVGRHESQFVIKGNRWPPTRNYSYAILENTHSRGGPRLHDFLQHYEESARNAMAVVVLLTPEQVRGLEYDRELIIHPMDSSSIKRLLRTRMEYFGGNVSKIISASAIEEVSKNSLGVPGVALEIMANAFKTAFKKRKAMVKPADVAAALQHYINMDMNELRLTNKEKDILQHLLLFQRESATPNELSACHGS